MATTSTSVTAHPTTDAANLQPWVEKYRPRRMDDISSQEETIQVLKKTLQSNNLPHLLFYGPPGTGKTTTILALARELFGPELMKSRVLELNASDERGIKVVREKIKTFARATVSSSHSHSSTHPCPPYKIIILDEADSMTTDAQSALRRVMENYSKITRFCLICNYVSRIIEPLTSRCAKFRFKLLDMDSAESRLRMICEKENVKTIEEVIKVSDGDLRKAVTYLQSAHSTKLYQDTPIPADAIDEIAGVIPKEVVNNFLSVIQGSSVEKIASMVEDFILNGYSANQLITQLTDQLVLCESIKSVPKSKIMIKLAQVDKALLDGSDEHLQLLDFATYVAECVAASA